MRWSLGIALMVLVAGAAKADLASKMQMLRLSRMQRPADAARYVTRIQNKQFKVEYRPETSDASIPFSRIHSWELKIQDLKGRPVKGAQVVVEPIMVQHSHGMLTDLKVRELGPGRYRVEGLKFHMPGWWTVEVKITVGQKEESALAFHLLVETPAIADDRDAARNADLLKSLWIGSLPKLSKQDFPSNPYALDAEAAALGKTLFFDQRLSKSEKISCAVCHRPERAFSSDHVVFVEGRGNRKAPSVLGAAWQSWFFWDGRKDSLWSQPLASIENSAEHNLPREEWVKKVRTFHAPGYAKVFGPIEKHEVDLAFANTGKALAAYEATLIPEASAFDRYAESVIAGGEEKPVKRFGDCEKAGLRLFTGNARCINCHSGPRFENNSFHNTGVPMLEGDSSRTRFNGVTAALEDPFNCRGKFSRDSKGKAVRDCKELDFAPRRSPALGGAFKTPSLRNVALTSPYMHGGQFKNLEEVLNHYGSAPSSAIGSSELIPIALNPEEKRSLVCFLNSLTSENYVPAQN